MGAGNKRYGAKDRKQFNNDTKDKEPNMNPQMAGLPLLLQAIILGVMALIYGLYWLNKEYGGKQK